MEIMLSGREEGSRAVELYHVWFILVPLMIVVVQLIIVPGVVNVNLSHVSSCLRLSTIALPRGDLCEQ